MEADTRDCRSDQKLGSQEKNRRSSDDITTFGLQDDTLFTYAPRTTERRTNLQAELRSSKESSFPEHLAVTGSEHHDRSDLVKGVNAEMEIVCGPLLNYKGIGDAGSESST